MILDRPHTGFVFSSLVAIALLGCDGNSQSSQDAKPKSSRHFQVPADGKLTERQVIEYIGIRKKVIQELEAQQASKQSPSAYAKNKTDMQNSYRYFDEIEKTVANSINMSYEEYLWIKDTVINTKTSVLIRRYYDLNHKIMSLLDKTLMRYEEINTNKPDKREQEVMDNYIDEMKQEMNSLREKIPEQQGITKVQEHNAEVISKFQSEIDSLDQQATRVISKKSN